MNYRFYRTSGGRCHVEEFLNGLFDKQAGKAAWVFALLEQHTRSELVRTRYFKKLKNADDIWEVRVGFGGDIFRFLGFFDREVFIINHAFMKKEQKTRNEDIELSKWRRSEYFFLHRK